MKKLILFLFILNYGFGLSLTKVEIISIPNLLRPKRIFVNNDFIYIIDYLTENKEGNFISVYSLRNFKKVGQFGRFGEGPQQMMDFRSLVFQDKVILAQGRVKALYFNPRGEFIKEIKSPMIFSQILTLKALKTNFTGYLQSNLNGLKIKLYDENFKEIKAILSKEMNFFNKKKRKVNLFCNRILNSHLDQIIINLSDDFVIEIFNQLGEKIHTLKRDYTPLEFTKKDQNKYWKFCQNKMAKAERAVYQRVIMFPDQYPAINTVTASDDLIYITTHLIKNNKRECFIYSSTGKFVKKIFIPLLYTNYTTLASPDFFKDYAIKNHKLYQLVENPDQDTWELHITLIQ